MLDQARQAERLGYDTFWVAEHHFHEYGAVPNPAVFLAALSQQTRRLRLGTAISILTFHNPLTVAENYALVDQLSQGRLSLGVGSGYLKHEFEGYDVDPAIKRERFDENLMLVERLLAGERVTHESRHNTIREVRINVQPVQQPVPVYVAILRREAAYHVGRQGRRMLFVPYAAVDSFEEIGLMMQDYRRGLAEAGIEDASGMAAVALHTHVARPTRWRASARPALSTCTWTRVCTRASRSTPTSSPAACRCSVRRARWPTSWRGWPTWGWTMS